MTKTLKTQKSTSRQVRWASGSAIVEFGPALFLLVTAFFFTMIDLLGLGISYASCLMLNKMQTREAALIKSDKAARIKVEIPAVWQGSGLGKYAQVIGFPWTEIKYGNGQKRDDGTQDKTVTVTTTAICKPFLTVPFVGSYIPGLGSPMIFKVASQRPMENPDYAGQAK